MVYSIQCSSRSSSKISQNTIVHGHHPKVFNATALTVFVWSHWFGCQKLLQPCALIEQINKSKTSKQQGWVCVTRWTICLYVLRNLKEQKFLHFPYYSVNSIVKGKVKHPSHNYSPRAQLELLCLSWLGDSAMDWIGNPPTSISNTLSPVWGANLKALKLLLGGAWVAEAGWSFGLNCLSFWPSCSVFLLPPPKKSQPPALVTMHPAIGRLLWPCLVFQDMLKILQSCGSKLTLALSRCHIRHFVLSAVNSSQAGFWGHINGI